MTTPSLKSGSDSSAASDAKVTTTTTPNEVSDNDDETSTSAAWTLLKTFLDDCESTLNDPPRMECPCCGASRKIYCYDCCEILLPPTPEQERPPVGLTRRRGGNSSKQDLQLPFAVDLILDDRRASSTGVHAFTMLKVQTTNNGVQQDTAMGNGHHRLFDQPKGDGIPDDYASQEGVYFLFPDKTSVGLSSVATKVRRLVVLDCKWTKSFLRNDPRLASVPKVHLDHPPSDSFFWRWHTSGAGMLSTIEAIYFAAWDVAVQKEWTLERRQNLVNLLWTFGLQRAVIQGYYEKGKGHRLIPHMPFSEDGKECARRLRIKDTNKKKH